MRTLVTTDTHGNYKELVQALERANFDPVADMLIHLGDVSDRGPDTKDCVEFLLHNCNVALKGNHDVWTNEWMNDYIYSPQPIWTTQGGQETIDSYGSLKDVPDPHKEFFKNQKWYYVDEQNRCFVHAGWDHMVAEGPDEYFQEDGTPHRDVEDLVWTRDFLRRAMNLEFTKSFTKKKFTKFDEVFIGHTTLESFKPTKFCEVWALDTGAVYGGVLTVMDVDTHEYWQSDDTKKLYPNLRF